MGLKALADKVSARDSNGTEPAKTVPSDNTTSYAEWDNQRLEDWFSDFAERYAVNRGNGMAEEDAQKDALVYTLKYALRHFVETGAL